MNKCCSCLIPCLGDPAVSCITCACHDAKALASPPTATAARSTFPAGSCQRCGSTERIITGDSTTVCRICIYAWGAYAGRINNGPASMEMGPREFAHQEHRVPYLGCYACVKAAMDNGQRLGL